MLSSLHFFGYVSVHVEYNFCGYAFICVTGLKSVCVEYSSCMWVHVHACFYSEIILKGILFMKCSVIQIGKTFLAVLFIQNNTQGD